MIYLASNLHGLLEIRCSCRDDEIFLEGELVTGMTSSIDNVKTWHGHGELLLLITSQIGIMLVEWYILSGSSGLGDSQTDSQDGIGTQFGFVGGTVELDHDIVNGTLIGRILSNDGRSEDIIDISNGLEDTLSKVAVSTVTELICFVGSSGGTGWDRGTEKSSFSGNLNLNGGVTSGVEDLSGLDSSNGISGGGSGSGCFGTRAHLEARR
mmetsp:Transcript_18497/g.27287  ORF Transcript_18497/g.27287 Transcript_18497/m.27287 type:complete len:210 (+) Transcript_18497:516-1145(+)